LFDPNGLQGFMALIEPLGFLGSQAGLAQHDHHRRSPAAVSGQQARFLLRRQIGNPFYLA
jgi:hypothetical protein